MASQFTFPGSTNGINMADSLSTPFSLNGQMTPEMALEEQAINRRQQIANLLMQRGLQGAQGQMAGRFYVAPSWTQGLAQLGSAAAGVSLGRANDADRRDLAKQSNDLRVQAIQDFMDKTSGKAVSQPIDASRAEMPDTFDIDQLQGGATQGMTPSTIQFGQPGSSVGVPIREDLGAAPTTATNTVMQPPNERDWRKAMIDAMTSGVPGMKEAAMLQMQQKAAQDEKATQRDFLSQEKALDRDVRLQGIQEQSALRVEQMKQNMNMLQMNIDARERAGQDANDLKKQLAAQQADLQKQLHAMDIQGRKDVAAIAADAKKEAKFMSPTMQKELIETDDKITAGTGVLTALDAALAINDKAYEGAAADTRAAVASNLPLVGKEGANATVELNNIITNQALGQLKATFGAMPTEGERKVLLEVQGSVNMTAPQRKAIFERAKEMVARRLTLDQQKAKQIREGTYLSEGGGPQVPPAAQSGPAKITNDAEFDALPSGSTFIGPDGVTRKKP